MRQLVPKVSWHVFWEFPRPLGCTESAMLPKQARKIFRKNITKHSKQAAAPDCIGINLSDGQIWPTCTDGLPFVCGGRTEPGYSDICYKYSPLDDSWQQHGTLPSERADRFVLVTHSGLHPEKNIIRPCYSYIQLRSLITCSVSMFCRLVRDSFIVPIYPFWCWFWLLGT